MLRARIADRTVELIGCDTMQHADKLTRFPCQNTAPADFCMWVTYAPAVPIPDGEPIGEHGNTKWIRLADARRVLYHADGNFSLTFDDRFCEVSLLIKEGLPQADILHYLYVSQCFAYHLLANGGCSLHSAGMAIDGSGVALCGVSGVGKSTMVRHIQALDKTATVLCEDAPLLIPCADGWRLCGSPFCGDDDGCANVSVPLRGIVLLRQGTHNRIIEPTAEEALFGLLSTAPRPVYHEALCETAADRLLQLSKQVPILLFENNGTRAAGEQLLAALRDREWMRPKGDGVL